MGHYETHPAHPAIHNNGSTVTKQICTRRIDGTSLLLHPAQAANRTCNRNPAPNQVSLSGQLVFQHPPSRN